MATPLPLLSRCRQLAFEVESTRGTYNDPAFSTKSILAYDVTLTTQFGRFSRDVQRGTLTKLAGIVGQRTVQLSFTLEAYHDAAVNTPDHWMNLFTACGMKATAASGTSGGSTYKFEDAVSDTAPLSNQTLSFKLAMASRGGAAGSAFGVKIKGASGTFTVEARVGAPILFKFTFTGVFHSFEDVTLAAPTMPTVVPAVFHGVGFGFARAGQSINSDLCLSQFTFDAGVSVVPRECVNATEGVDYFTVVDRRPVGSFDPDLQLMADSTEHDYHSFMSSNTDCKLEWSLADVMSLTIPSLRITSVADGNRNGIQTASLDFEVVNETAESDVTIAFL